MSEAHYYIGLDLGQAHEFTALAVLERPVKVADVDPINVIPHLHRFPLGAPYTEIITEVTRLLSQSPLNGAPLLVDQTGVGQPVVDMFRKAHLDSQIIPVTITSGGASVKTADGHHVPKKDLVGALQVVLQTRRLRIAKSQANVPILIKELENFRAKVTTGSVDPLEAWREGQHDDLVLAVALTCWWAERKALDLHQFLDDLISVMPKQPETPLNVQPFGWSRGY